MTQDRSGSGSVFLSQDRGGGFVLPVLAAGVLRKVGVAFAVRPGDVLPHSVAICRTREPFTIADPGAASFSRQDVLGDPDFVLRFARREQ